MMLCIWKECKQDTLLFAIMWFSRYIKWMFLYLSFDAESKVNYVLLNDCFVFHKFICFREIIHLLSSVYTSTVKWNISTSKILNFEYWNWVDRRYEHCSHLRVRWEQRPLHLLKLGYLIFHSYWYFTSPEEVFTGLYG